MRHFVQYHNLQKQKPLDVTERVNIFTKKSARELVGNRVWLISGKGKPVAYELCGTFVVTEVEETSDHKVAWGSNEKWLEDPPRINDQPWFLDIKRVAGNFGLGLQEVTKHSAIVSGLEQVYAECFDSGEQSTQL